FGHHLGVCPFSKAPNRGKRHRDRHVSYTKCVERRSLALDGTAFQEYLDIVPAFLARLIAETLDRTGPFGVQFRDSPELVSGAEPAGLNVFGIGASPVGVVLRGGGGNFAGGAPGQLLGKLGLSYAHEMVLQRPGFKPAAGGGEV